MAANASPSTSSLYGENTFAKDIGYDDDTLTYVVTERLVGTLVGHVVGTGCICTECDPQNDSGQDNPDGEERLRLGDEINCEVVKNKIDHLMKVNEL
jgi:hypothetical protein